MSDLLAAAAAALGTPEALVKRSAEARAEATGATVDDILAAWAGGAPAPAPAAAQPAAQPAQEAEPVPAVETAPQAPPPVPAPAAAAPAVPAPPPAPAGPYKPPTLVGATDNPRRLVVASLGLFVVVALVGLVGPSLPADNPGARSSEIAFSASALHGRDVYVELGCASCHTQMVRPVVADVGLGAVTLNDTNQVPGTRRFGPDLSNAGARLTSEQTRAIIEGFGDHPQHTLSGDDLDALVAYLSESITAEPEDE
jgi:hypothetical protein